MTDAEGVQQELQDYLHKKGINTLFINLVESLLLAKPENPILHIIQYLQTNFPEEATPRRKSGGGKEDNPAASPNVQYHSDESESEDEDEGGDAVGEIAAPVPPPKIMAKGRRTSVSAETIDPLSARQFERVVHPKSAEEREGISRMVAENILFKSLDEKQHDIVLDAMFPKEFEPGDIIIKQGDDGDNFYILESGVCEVYKDDELVQTCTEAMSFGELALMYNAPRAATVKAVQHSKAWALDRQTFKFIIMETTLKKREAHKGFIERVPLLESLSEYERLTVADALKTETFSDGEVIITQGDDGNLFYIIEEGTAVCTKQLSPADPPVEMGQLTSGAYFGEIALLTTRPRQATVTAKGKVKCLTLDRKTFKRVMGPLEDILKRNIDKYNSVIANNI
ncbi:cyclic AMP-dependent protein kinase-like protein regulatory subunit [Phytophthora sojae]|uniref:cAMP-dependent protein kinase regulatory subunit n=1 Tax=Phytophthora sojae (strain P6497) TaxID=1094619 RepID=G4YL55_PHYSP|nr:cyclic AMP-dependent protein kinase-like protein regulatory subunit [Phytophthora sojae]EGZ29970.1 cyclic AMP-dependent protein kinase-like protein regulatory subunit [Phytophthora sojae]|eukprot:XP_009517245.1 cyclic AMP-dependent protein kinase-like protein regulatory subunit [Phytophthora sojae]